MLYWILFRFFVGCCTHDSRASFNLRRDAARCGVRSWNERWWWCNVTAGSMVKMGGAKSKFWKHYDRHGPRPPACLYVYCCLEECDSIYCCGLNNVYLLPTATWCTEVWRDSCWAALLRQIRNRDYLKQAETETVGIEQMWKRRSEVIGCYGFMKKG